MSSPTIDSCALLLPLLLVTFHSVCHVSTNRIDPGVVIEIAEELAAGTVIIDNIYRRLQLNEPTTQSPVYAAIANPASPGVNSLVIRPHRFDGTLQLAVRDGVRGPDREELCNVGQRSGAHQLAVGTVPHCDLTLVIVHGNRQNPSYAKVTLRITDINDNAPSFPKGDQFELRIPEDPAASSSDDRGHFFSPLVRPRATQNKYPLPLAYDPDLNGNSVKYYRLTTSTGQEIDNSVITLTNQNEDDAANSGDVQLPALKVIGLLDRERTSDYWFNLLALDGGVPQKTGTLTVHVIVTDLNDNAPKFRTPIYHFPTFFANRADYTSLPNDPKNEILRIPESTSVGVDLVSLSAEDPDEGANAQLTYHIKEHLSDEPDGRTSQTLQLVRVNDMVKLRVAKPLDADIVQGTFWSDSERDLHGNLIYITVEVTDAGIPPLSSSLTLPILIENVNDNAPEIFVQFTNPVQLSTLRVMPGNHSRLAGSLRENLLGPNTIAHVTVTDADRLVSPQNHGRYPQVRESVRCELNDSRFSLEQLPSMSSQSSPDLGFGTSLSQSSYFYRMSALSAFDREESEWIRILITCIDQVTTGQSGYGFGQSNQYRLGTPSTGSAIITLQVLDVNDNSPKCLMETYRFSTFETPTLPGLYMAGPGLQNDHTTIGQVKARDLDTEMNGLVRYKLLTNPNGAFKIDQRDGTVIRMGHLDREKESQVSLTVEVYDQGNPSLSSTCSILIDILDVNDHPPYWVTSIINDDRQSAKWVKSEDGVFYFSVPEDTEVGQVIGLLTAVDVDGIAQSDTEAIQPTERPAKPTIVGEGKLLYQLESVDEASMFSINRRTGELRLNRKLDRETRAHYELRAFAVDNTDSMTSSESGRPWITTQANRFTATATVFVTVLDVNDNAPQFESPLPGQEFHIDPSSPLATPGTTLFTAIAHDSDSGENATVRYALEGQGYGLVEIDSSTGVCYIREAVHKHSLARLHALSSAQVYPTDRDKHTAQVDSPAESQTQSELRSLILNLIIVAYDMGVPRSMNSSRRVRLVWDTQTAQTAQSVYPYQGVLKGLYGVQNGKLTRTEHLLIPLMIGAFLLLIVVCLILFGLARRRRRIKQHVNSRRSPSSESFHRANWCTACLHPSLTERRLGDAAKGGSLARETSGEDQKRKEIEATAANMQRINLLGRPNSVCTRPFLPDCIPQMEPDRIATPQHNQIGHLLINPPHLKSDWRTRSRYAGSTLSRALSDESLLNVGKEHEIGYTALCAFPSVQPEDEDRLNWTHRPVPYHKEPNRSPGAYGEVDPMMTPAISTAPRLARPIAYRPQTLNIHRPGIYNPQSGFTTATTPASSLVYPTFHSTAYGLSPTEPSEMHYEAFDLDQTQKKDQQPAGWKPALRLASHYTENTFV